MHRVNNQHFHVSVVPLTATPSYNSNPTLPYHIILYHPWQIYDFMILCMDVDMESIIQRVDAVMHMEFFTSLSQIDSTALAKLESLTGSCATGSCIIF